MNYSIKYKHFLLLFSVIALFSGCNKNKFLSVNTNPNYPVTVPVNYALPSAEANIGYMVSNTLSIYGGLWAEYWTQDQEASQFDELDSYVSTPADNINMWPDLYAVGVNLNYVIANADSTQQNYAAIAYIMKAYNFQLLCDGFDEIPLDSALQGRTYVSPIYDQGQTVYDSLIVWVNKGLSIIAKTAALYPTSPPEDLVYPNQPMTQWQKFANTLLLKIYIRESIKNPSAASAGIQALTNSGATYLTMPSTDDAKLLYNSQLYQQFPLYSSFVSLGSIRNLMASATCINVMKSLGDPRIQDLYAATPGGNYNGALQGDFLVLAGQGIPDSGFCAVGPEVFGPTASTRFITASESLFLQAEAVARGYMGGSAASLYYEGIQASWSSWAYSSAAMSQLPTYENQNAVNFSKAGGVQAQVQLIILQKWLSMCGNQNYEAWTEWRRIGFPSFFTISVNQQDGGIYPERLIYPSEEVNNNANFDKVGLQPITKPVWWSSGIQ